MRHSDRIIDTCYNGANINMKREYGVTALKLARAKGNKEIEALLKARGAKE